MHAYQTSSQHGQSRSPASSQQEAEQAQMPSRYPEVALSLTNYRKLFPRGLPLAWQNVHCWCCLQTKDKHTEVGQLSRIPLVFLLHFFQKKMLGMYSFYGLPSSRSIQTIKASKKTRCTYHNQRKSLTGFILSSATNKSPEKGGYLLSQLY